MSERTPPNGRVIYGLQLGDFAHLNRPAAATWNMETEARYMEQVRERAQQKAKEILNQALQEAEQIRHQAHAEGFAAGQTEAATLIRRETDAAAHFVASIHGALAAEKERIYIEHKQTLFHIMRLAFEKTLGIVLAENRENILQSLFEDAVGQLQARTCVTLFVSPENLEFAREMALQAKAARPELPELRVISCDNLASGGVRVESGDGLVDNSIAARFEQVRAILDGYLEHS